MVAFATAWATTLSASMLVYPLDSVRRCMMMRTGEAVKYTSSYDAYTQIVAKHGFISLFKGGGANVIRALAGAGTITLYEHFQKVMTKR